MRGGSPGGPVAIGLTRVPPRNNAMRPQHTSASPHLTRGEAVSEVSRCAGRGRPSGGGPRGAPGCPLSAAWAWSGRRGRTGSSPCRWGRGPCPRRLRGALGLGRRLRRGPAGPVTAVYGLLRDPERGAHGVPREAQRAVEVDGGGHQGLDAVAQLLGQADGRGGSAPVDDEARGGAGAARAVDVAELGGEGAQCVHLPADPLDVPYQEVQAGPCLGVVGCVVGHEQASRDRR